MAKKNYGLMKNVIFWCNLIINIFKALKKGLLPKIQNNVLRRRSAFYSFTNITEIVYLIIVCIGIYIWYEYLIRLSSSFYFCIVQSFFLEIKRVLFDKDFEIWIWMNSILMSSFLAAKPPITFYSDDDLL